MTSATLYDANWQAAALDALEREAESDPEVKALCEELAQHKDGCPACMVKVIAHSSVCYSSRGASMLLAAAIRQLTTMAQLKPQALN